MPLHYDSLIRTLLGELNLTYTLTDLSKLSNKYIGKKSYVSDKLSKLKFLSLPERKLLGRDINKLKKLIEEQISLHKQKLIKDKESMIQEEFDITLPGRKQAIGSIHPITHSINLLKSFCYLHGFQEKTGPNIENDWYNFTALNITEYHPARSMQDTFYIQNKNLENKTLLRTHTSNVQIRALENTSPPCRYFSIGTVYRADDLDSTHSPVFTQMEGMYIDTEVNIGHLKKFLIDLLHNFFDKEVKVRFRPSYFPFTEPSMEVDILWKDRWIELLGCGLIHKGVFDKIKINNYKGFAFGIGIERLVMIKYNINDIRDLYSANMEFIDKLNIY